MLKDLELNINAYPYLFTNNGIYPYTINDGGVTIGYGHYISKDLYQIDEYEKYLIDTYVKRTDVFSKGVWSVPTIIKDSEVVPFNVIDEIFQRDLKKHTKAINEWLEEENIFVTQEQFDALIMCRYNLGNIEVFLDCIKYSKSREDWEDAIKNRLGSNYTGGIVERYKDTFDLYFNKKYK